MFSGNYDKALAGLILANSAKELEMEVSMFFAFWGLLLLREPNINITEVKSSLEKLMGTMTPKGPDELPLSNMNFSGLGKKRLEAMMKEDGTPTFSNNPSFIMSIMRGVIVFLLTVKVIVFSKIKTLKEEFVTDNKQKITVIK
jgi:predicted peroxiredoxin